VLVEMLIKRGANVNASDADGNSPLHFVMNVFTKNHSKYKAMAESLILMGAKVNARNNDLWAPLHIASKKGQIEGIRWAQMTNQLLHDMGMETFDLNLHGGQDKWTPLHLAGYSGHEKVVEDILSGSLEQLSKFPINVYARTRDHKTPRQCARGNLVLTKIFRKAEKRYLKESLVIDQFTENELLVSSGALV
jgi:ankyrin repeat protein